MSDPVTPLRESMHKKFKQIDLCYKNEVRRIFNQIPARLFPYLFELLNRESSKDCVHPIFGATLRDNLTAPIVLCRLAASLGVVVRADRGGFLGSSGSAVEREAEHGSASSRRTSPRPRAAEELETV